MMELRIESGMEVATMRVDRQLPTNSRTASPARTAAVNISCTTSRIDAFTKPETSFSGVMVTPGGRVLSKPGSFALTPLTTARVEASPVFKTSMRTDC